MIWSKSFRCASDDGRITVFPVLALKGMGCFEGAMMQNLVT
jgi:hypothetical protein